MKTDFYISCYKEREMQNSFALKTYEVNHFSHRKNLEIAMIRTKPCHYCNLSAGTIKSNHYMHVKV